MNKKIKSLLMVIVMMICLAGVSSVLSADVTLAVPERFQEHSMWCWAGCSEATLEYYNQFPLQCEIANYAWNKTSCCGDYDFYSSVKGCNKSNFLYGNDGSIQGILLHWGVDSVGMDVPLNWTESTSELDNGFPFVMRWGWTQGGGHFLVGFGYISDGSYLEYMDPWPGEGYTTSTFTYVVSAEDHDWTHTLTTY